MPFFLGHILYIGLLLTNAIAILSEERFLARIGWSTLSTSHLSNSANVGFGTVPNSYDNSFGGAGGGGEGQSMKARMINLIAAVRTLMRIPLIAVNIVIILYELAWG